MTSIDNHGLTCLDGSDVAAVSLLLQSNAATIDSSLDAIADSLNAYNTRSWAVTTTNAAVTGSSTSNELVSGSFPPGFSLLAGSLSTQSFGMDSPPNFLAPILPTGWYLTGGIATFQATGAVTANSRRDLILYWTKTVSGQTVFEYSLNTVYESNTGGDALTVTGKFFADGISRYSLNLNFAHNNTGSTMQVNAGTKCWIAYIGTGVVV